jgi:hypothetical protein
LLDRNVGFRVERERTKNHGSERQQAKLVVINEEANDRFVRNIFEAFADEDTKLNNRSDLAHGSKDEPG